MTEKKMYWEDGHTWVELDGIVYKIQANYEHAPNIIKTDMQVWEFEMYCEIYKAFTVKYLESIYKNHNLLNLFYLSQNRFDEISG